MAVNPPSFSFQPVGTVPPGVYCNAVQILFSPWEFNFELSQLDPQAVIQSVATEGGAADQVTTQGSLTSVELHKHVVSRVVMSPQHTKALLKALQENVDRYEAEHGEIPEPATPDPGGAPQGEQ